MRANEFVAEKWSEKYKRSIDCSHPKGFSQRAHCQGRKKNEDLNEFAIDKGNGDDRSRLIGSIMQLLKAGKKVDFFVPGIRGHVVGTGGNGDWLTLKRWNKPHSKINYSLALDAGDDDRFALKLIKPDYYQVVEKDQLNEFAPASNPGGGNYLQALASAWYNDVFNTGNLHKGIKSQEDVEKILARGIHCGDGKIRKYGITYNPGFDGVIVSSDDYYNHSDYDAAGNEVDSRTGQPWGPYDYIEFSDSELDESQLNEFAPNADDNRENSPEDVLFRFAKMWYSAPDVATQRRVEQALAKIGWEIGELESEEGGAFVVEIGDNNGDSYLAWSEDELADQLNELSFRGSQCTKDCSGHRAGYEWSQRKGGRDAASWSPSFNKGAWLFKNGY